MNSDNAIGLGTSVKYRLGSHKDPCRTIPAVDLDALGVSVEGNLVSSWRLQHLAIAKGRSVEDKLRIHAGFVGVFLVVAHIAMIFGMLDPRLLA